MFHKSPIATTLLVTLPLLLVCACKCSAGEAKTNWPSPPVAAEAAGNWQVVDYTEDNCGAAILTILDGKNGDVSLQKGQVKFVEFSSYRRGFNWRCGDNPDKDVSGSDSMFLAITVQRLSGDEREFRIWFQAKL